MTVLFLVSALAVRYAVNFASVSMAGISVLVLGLAAAAFALREGAAAPVAGPDGRPLPRSASPLLVATCGGLALLATSAVTRLDRGDASSYFETGVLHAFGAGLVVLVAAGALIDRWFWRHQRRPRRP